MENRPTKIIWHNTADSDTSRQLNKVNDWHRQRGFPRSSLGFFIGYHYLVERDGSYTQARKETEEGAHTIGENFSSIGISLTGNFDLARPTQAQEQTAAKICADVMKRWNIKITETYPHRKYSNTSCPGKLLKDNWFAFNYIKWQLNWIMRLLYALRLKLLK